MYNQEIKERFLAEYVGNRKSSAQLYFELINEREELLGKDLAQMQKHEVVATLKHIHIRTYSTAFGCLSFLRSYVKWCDTNSVFKSVNPGLISLTVDDIDISEELKEILFESEDDLIKEIDSIRPFDDGYPESISMLLVWMGLRLDEITSIRIDDVNLEKKWVYVPCRDLFVSFSDRIADILRVYEKTKVGYRSAGGDSRPVFRDDSYDRYVRKYLPKGKSNDPFTHTQIKHITNHLNSIYVDRGNPPKFTPGNVLMSGALHRISMLEQSGVDVFSIKNKKIVTTAFVAKANLYEILWLYRNYKRALNL